MNADESLFLDAEDVVELPGEANLATLGTSANASNSVWNERGDISLSAFAGKSIHRDALIRCAGGDAVVRVKQAAAPARVVVPKHPSQQRLVAALPVGDQDVLELHATQLAVYGGSPGLRGRGLISIDHPSEALYELTMGVAEGRIRKPAIAAELERIARPRS